MKKEEREVGVSADERGDEAAAEESEEEGGEEQALVAKSPTQTEHKVS